MFVLSMFLGCHWADAGHSVPTWERHSAALWWCEPTGLLLPWPTVALWYTC